MNKKITQLRRLTSGSISSADLFVLVDVDETSTPTGETKATEASEFYGFMRDLGLGDSSSYSLTAESASHALQADSSSTSILAATASYLLNTADNALSGSATLYVSSSGSDVTGNESNPFKTINGVFKWLNDKNISKGSDITIALSNENHQFNSPEIIENKNANYIKIKGNNGSTPLSTNANYTSHTSQGEGAHTASFTVGSSFVNQTDVGDYILLTDTSINAKTLTSTDSSLEARSLCGVWKVIGKTPTTLQVFSTQQNNVLQTINSSIQYTIYLLKTKLTFTGCSGLVVSNGGIGSMEGFVVVGENQNLLSGEGGDGINIGEYIDIDNSTNLSTPLSQLDDNSRNLLKIKRGPASANMKILGVTGFGGSGISIRNGSAICEDCASSNNVYGFGVFDGGQLELRQSVASGNRNSGIFSYNNGSVDSKWSTIVYNKFYGILSKNNSVVSTDSNENTDCSLIRNNGWNQIKSINNSTVSSVLNIISDLYSSTSSYASSSVDYYSIDADNNSTVISKFSKIKCRNGFKGTNRSSIISDSSDGDFIKMGSMLNSSDLSIGNCELTRHGDFTSSFLSAKNRSTIYSPGAYIRNLGQGESNIIDLDNSSLYSHGDYDYDSTSNVSEKSKKSIQIEHSDSGSLIYCNNKSVAQISQFTGSSISYDLESVYGSLIRLSETSLSGLTYYPSGSPFDQNLAMVRSDV